MPKATSVKSPDEGDLVEAKRTRAGIQESQMSTKPNTTDRNHNTPSNGTTSLGIRVAHDDGCPETQAALKSS